MFGRSHRASQRQDAMDTHNNHSNHHHCPHVITLPLIKQCTQVCCRKLCQGECFAPLTLGAGCWEAHPSHKQAKATIPLTWSSWCWGEKQWGGDPEQLWRCFQHKSFWRYELHTALCTLPWKGCDHVLMPGWPEGLVVSSGQDLACIWGWNTVFTAWKSCTEPFHFSSLNELTQYHCTRRTNIGDVTGQGPLLHPEKQLWSTTTQKSHLHCRLSALLPLKRFVQGRESTHKAYLIRHCVGRMNSIPSEMEESVSPPDGEIMICFFLSQEKVSRCEYGAYLYWF